jgi:hypothetical protein
MNWSRGFLRLWLISSVLWISWVAWFAYEGAMVPRLIAAKQESCLRARKADSSLGNPFDCFHGGMSFADLIPWSTDIINYGALAFSPVVALLFIGLAIKWIAAGFRASKGRSNK